MVYSINAIAPERKSCTQILYPNFVERTVYCLKFTKQHMSAVSKIWSATLILWYLNLEIFVRFSLSDGIKFIDYIILSNKKFKCRDSKSILMNGRSECPRAVVLRLHLKSQQSHRLQLGKEAGEARRIAVSSLPLPLPAHDGDRRSVAGGLEGPGVIQR